MKKTFLLIYIIIFLVVCMMPSILTVLGVQSVNYEKRELASKPMMVKDGINLDYTKDFDDYFSDNFALRPYLISLYSYISANVFHTSTSEKVVMGKNGFLFFSETMASFTGQDAMTDEELTAICEKIKMQQDILEAQGKAFIFLCAPNKNTIYPGNMPNRYPTSLKASNMTRLYDMMDAYGINYIDVRGELIDAKTHQQVYHSTDSHWNNFGAITAYDLMMREVKGMIEGMTYVDFLSMPYVVEKTHTGDLSVMLYPSSKKKDLQMKYDFEQTYSSERPIVNLEALEIMTENETQDKRVYIFRDSFFNALIPFFSESFASVIYSRSVPYDFETASDADIVILEIVERNLPILLENLD